MNTILKGAALGAATVFVGAMVADADFIKTSSNESVKKYAQYIGGAVAGVLIHKFL